MKVSELAKALDYKLIVQAEEDGEVVSGYTSDLLSDVMGNVEEGSVLITIQAHTNTIAVAMQLDLPAVIICNTRPIPKDMEESAKKGGIAVMVTGDNQFIASYKVFKALNLSLK
jgi:hypothetical protein